LRKITHELSFEEQLTVTSPDGSGAQDSSAISDNAAGKKENRVMRAEETRIKAQARVAIGSLVDSKTKITQSQAGHSAMILMTTATMTTLT
jgi:hypothetical protein